MAVLGGDWRDGLLLSMEGKAALGEYRRWWWRSRRTALHCGQRSLSLCACARISGAK